MFITHDRCRICHNPLTFLFEIAAPLVSDFPLAGVGNYGGLRVPVEVMRCVHCEHVQLHHSVAPEVLYKEYWYESGINGRMVHELASIVEAAHARVEIEVGDSVLDIGANDGTLLKQYSTQVNRIAVEPSDTFQQQLRQIAGLTIQGTFPECASQLDGPFKVITSVACFYDIDDPVRAVEEIRRLLHPYGCWIAQFQDLEQQTRRGAHDNFLHEHTSYYSLQTFEEAVRRGGLQVVDCETSDINGGSLRVFVKHAGVGPVQGTNLQEQRYREFQTLTTNWPQRFYKRYQHNIAQIHAYVASVTEQGGVVDMVGASTKSNSLLQSTQITDLIRCAWERNPRKYSPARTTITGVPIIDEALGRANPPDVLLLGIWQFKDQIIAREAETLRKSHLIIPLPEACWVMATGKP